MRQIVDALRLRITQIDSPYLLHLRWMNGEPFIHLGGLSHHRSSPDVVELLHVRDHDARTTKTMYARSAPYAAWSRRTRRCCRLHASRQWKIPASTEPVLANHVGARVGLRLGLRCHGRRRLACRSGSRGRESAAGV
ncbi:Imm7 family immunity protein [Streptomyces bauhiniae]|uniref:Imm7 family immunity protein n=1 Tax=Streptomyces bauhiniae TaxID=2340725 RepID=UPI00365EAC64